MWSVNQMFYGTEEPVWLVDGTTPAPVKYHYLGSGHRASPPRPRRVHFDDELVTDSYLRKGSHHGQRSVHTPSYALPHSTMPYSSINPPPAPMVVPRETAISHTPVLPVATPGMPSFAPYTLLLRVPICCEGCEKRIIKKLRRVDGVMSVSCDIHRQRVTVRGTADTDEVLRVAKKAFKRSSLW